MRLGRISALVVFIGASVPAISNAQSDTDSARSSDTRAGFHGSVHINALGPLQFGIAPALELGTPHASGLLRLRWMNPGLLSQSLVKEGSDEQLAFSYGLALGGRYYTSPKTALDGLHFGVWGELLRVRLEDTDVDREAYNSIALVPQVEAGYRFRLGSFLLGASGALGYALALSKETEDLSGGQDPTLREVDFENQPYGAVNFDVGVFF